MADKKLRNVSKTMLAVNLDTTVNGKRESIVLRPGEETTVSEAQFHSQELKELVNARLIVDLSASESLRKLREKERQG